MRRHYYDFLFRNYYGLILDCLSHCLFTDEISFDEYSECINVLDLRKKVFCKEGVEIL